MKQEELQNLKKTALDQMLSGKNFIEKALEAEMDGHLDESERSKGNKSNGRGKKLLKTGIGTFDIQTL